MFSPPAWFSMNAERVRELADVVVVGRHAGQQRIGADRLRRPLGEVADHQRVVVRAGRLDEQPAQERLRRVRELEQLEDRQDPEQAAEDRERADRRDRRARRRRDRRADELEEAADVVEPEQRERRDDEHVRDGDREAAWTKTCSRSPRRIATIPARPPRKM